MDAKVGSESLMRERLTDFKDWKAPREDIPVEAVVEEKTMTFKQEEYQVPSDSYSEARSNE